MTRNQDIICISSIDWDFVWQGHQEIMTRLTRNGNRVLFIENTGVRAPKVKDIGRIKKRIANWRKGVYGIRKIEDRLYVYSPLVLPFPYLRIARFINKKVMFSVLFKWLKAVGFSDPIVWAFLPTGLSLDLIDKIEPKILVYYCIDSFQASSKDAKKIKLTEKMLLKKADLVFVTSMELFRYCSEHADKVSYFPFGVNIENFTKALQKTHTAPDEIKNIKRPMAGYVGGLHRWIDFDLVRHAARENKDISFVFCGPVQADISPISGMPNIFLLGQKQAYELPYYIKEFDIALIPYRITEYTNNVYPTKLNEYLSMGKRVISTDLPEIKKFNAENDEIVTIADSKETFARAVRCALEAPIKEDEKKRAMRAAQKNSWSNKIEEMSALIERVEYEKAGQREKLWKGTLTKFYKNARKKFVPAIAALVLAYMTVFYSPLLWFFAKPLVIKDAPVKADVIVALGAGVGESGEVGQGYEERVDSAVKLYKKGFSEGILYSSGYHYIMKEAQVMKALSISIGVDAENILTDDTPVTSYEMIRNLEKAVRKYGWRKILLVSSPYHMLRLKLLCDKYLKGVKVIYVPVEKSSFYARGRKITIRQIGGIIHEYAAILFYKLKNYI